MVSTRSSSRALPDGLDALNNPPKDDDDNKSTALGWSHTPTPVTLFWLLVSLPLVAWDTGYILLRPWTMPGGPLHWPLYVPYALYGKVDQVYGWKAFDARNGFASAQGSLNVIETVMYLVYVWLYFSRGRPVEGPAGAKKKKKKKVVGGRAGALAVVVGFSAAVMTLSKTVLYCECRGSARLWRTSVDDANGGQGRTSTSPASTTLATTRPWTSSYSGSSPSKYLLLHLPRLGRNARTRC